MYKIPLFKLVAGMLLAAVLIQGCALAPPPSADLAAAGISLQPVPEDDSLLWWECPGFNWHRYHSILLDPIIVNLPEDKRQALSPETLEHFVNEIRPALSATLAPEYDLAAEKGTGVLRLRVTLTDIETANPALNLATTLAVFVPLDMGGASIQAEFFDSLTGERVAAMADRKTGTPLQLRSGFSRLGHARAAVDQWAQALKTALAENP